MANTPVDGVAAARTMLGFGTWRVGHCLEAVWTAYSRNGAKDLTGEREPTAYIAWQHSDGKVTGVPYDQIPAGVPVYFGPKASSSAGDVVISLGGGMCVATDIPGRPGVIGKMKLSDRQRQIGRPYLGYTRTILDYPIKQGVAPKPPTPSKEITVKHYFRDDAKAKAAGGVSLKPGEGYWLNTTAKSARSQASNIVGGIGEYSFATHLYAEGEPGDVLELVLAWDNTKTTGPHSMHFVQRVALDKNGRINDNAPFARAVAAGYAVYAHVSAPESNTAPVKVTRFATDSLLFIAA